MGRTTYCLFSEEAYFFYIGYLTRWHNRKDYCVILRNPLYDLSILLPETRV
jgi:hypothetical protein